VQKESATPGVSNFRLLADAMDELCSAHTQADVARISATLAQKACGVDQLSLVMATGEQWHLTVTGSSSGEKGSIASAIATSGHSKLVTRMAAWTLEARQTAVVPDVNRDDRTRSHTNGTHAQRSLVVVPVGGRSPFATVTFAWAQEHWPAASDVLVLEAIARAAGLALTAHADSQSTDRDDGTSVHNWLGSAAEAEGVRGSDRRHWLVVAELEHRVRNLLGLVRSLVRRTAETRVTAEDFSAHLEGRICALARTQGLLMRQTGEGVELAELVDAELIAHAARDGRVESAGPPVRLRAKAAETLSLALHELMTNAVKYGALASPDGRLAITWRRDLDREDPCVRLEWRESGVPVPAATPQHRGFGRDLIERTVPYELLGATRFSFEPDGIRCIIDIPITPGNVVPGEGAIAE
jgi:two-component sensor histidine kinase